MVFPGLSRFVSIRAVLAIALVLPITLALAGRAGADPYIEVSTHTSVVVTRLNLQSVSGDLSGYLTIDARIVDSAAVATVHLPAGGGTWAVASAVGDCGATTNSAGTDVRCVVPRAGKYVFTVHVHRKSGSVAGLWGSTGAAYSGPPDENGDIRGFAVTNLDTFPIVDLDAVPVSPSTSVTGEVRQVELGTDRAPGGVDGAAIAITLNVPAGATAYAADVALPIQPAAAWTTTSNRPDRAPRWFCSTWTVPATPTVQTLSCAYDDANGVPIPLEAGVHTLIMHLEHIGALASGSTGSVSIRTTPAGGSVPVDTFPVVVQE